MADSAASELIPAPKRALIVQTAYVGDVVFASPLVYALKSTFPDCTVAMLVQPAKADVAACIPGVDEVLTFDKRGRDGGPLGLLRVARKIRRANFDLLLSPHRSSRTALLSKFSRVPLRVGFSSGLGSFCYRPAIEPKSSETSRLVQEFELLRAVGIESSDYRLRLQSPPKLSSYLDSFNRSNKLTPDARLVALCIGSVWPTKRWPTVYFASLIEMLRVRACHPVLFGGPEEVAIAREIEDLVREGQQSREEDELPNPGPTVLSCVGNSLSEAAALLSKCDMTVGSDSGLTHMSRALGVPTVIVYGPTDPRQHRFGDHSRVLTARVQCRPCSRHGHNRCPERHHDCMRLVSPEQVMDAFREIGNLQTPVPHENREAALNEQAVEGIPFSQG